MRVHCVALGMQAWELGHGQVAGRHLSGNNVTQIPQTHNSLHANIPQANTSVRTHGGYTPLHIAAQHNHQEVFDLLVGAYKADANVRDYAGKKPRQYMMVQV